MSADSRPALFKRSLVVAALLGLAAGPARAQAEGAAPAGPDKPWRDFELTLGWYISNLSSGVTVKDQSGLGAFIDLEETLSLDTSLSVGRLGAMAALGERHRLHFDFFDLSRKGTTDLTTEIRFDGETYIVGTTVDSRLNLQFFNLAYGYSILQDDRFDIAATLGIHGIRAKISLKDASNNLSEAERFYLPVPMPGLRGTFALTPDLFLKQNLEILWLRVGDYSGFLLDSTTALEYALFSHVGVGVAYNTLNFDLKMDDDAMPGVRFEGEVELRYSGVMLYTVLFF